MKKFAYLLFILLLTGCNSNAPDSPATEAVAVDEPAVEEALPTEEAPVEEPLPSDELVERELFLRIAGEEEMVFDWSSERCEEEHIPDIAPRAFRDAEGLVHLTIGHLKTYGMIGPDLNTVETDCDALMMTSDLNDDPTMFNDGEWIGGLYTEDGQTVYAILHSEYRGLLHTSTRPGQCPSGDYLTCLDTALTMAISTDGGRSFQDIAESPDHLVATLPYQYDDQGVPSGLRQPSNIMKGPDGYFYVYSSLRDYPSGDQWTCLMRTDNLVEPGSWRYWDGSGFNGEFLNPYIEDVGENPQICAPLELFDLGASQTDSITYNTVLEKYILVGLNNHPTSTVDKPMWGVYYSVSDDLINWSRRRFLLALPMIASVEDDVNDLIYAYPVLLDPDSESLNFDTTNDEFYLYVPRFNFGGASLDRDLVRWLVKIEPATYEPPVWNFDTDGDFEAWAIENELDNYAVSDGVLSMESSGPDPFMYSPAVDFPADQYTQLSITMKVSASDRTSGEIFFITDTTTDWGQNEELAFEIISDGEFHTYDLDMSSLDGWQGLIQQIRIDPVTNLGRTIEIDQIVISP